MKKRSKKGDLAIGVAWYRPNQYSRILSLSTDRKSMHSNYIDWEKSAEENTEMLRKSGLHVEKVDIDVDEVLAWCNERNLSFNGESRSTYVLEVVRKKYEGK